MPAANFCYRCGQRFAPAYTTCPGCGAERRLVLGGRPPPLPAPKAFEWVWCHFFRNAFLFALVLCVGGAIGTGVDGWLGGAILFAAAALFAHAWHATVCRVAHARRLKPLAGHR
jgi:hypothetical protein